jgi:hypothetical protein
MFQGEGIICMVLQPVENLDYEELIRYADYGAHYFAKTYWNRKGRRKP